MDDAELQAAGSSTLPLGAAATVAADALTVTIDELALAAK